MQQVIGFSPVSLTFTTINCTFPAGRRLFFKQKLHLWLSGVIAGQRAGAAQMVSDTQRERKLFLNYRPSLPPSRPGQLSEFI